MDERELAAFTRDKWTPYRLCPVPRARCRFGRECKRIHGTWEEVLDFLLAVERRDRNWNSVDLPSFAHLGRAARGASFGGERRRMALFLASVTHLSEAQLEAEALSCAVRVAEAVLAEAALT
jgi:hypothetical protein